MRTTIGRRSVAATGTPQPLIGTTLTAAVVPSQYPVALAVADSTPFAVGDYIWIGTGSGAERQPVTAVGASTVTVPGLGLPHASGAFVVLDAYTTAIYVESVAGNTAALDLFYWDAAFNALASHGRKSLSPAASGAYPLLVSQLQPVASGVQATYLSSANNYGANPDNISFWWIAGTANDLYVPSFDTT